ncbi:glucosylglycerol 3-phosphatase [Prochlorococcus sp. MIT 1300]|uniref:glucosylglycerol 3-phosphatase n=1 Tax=Prochlorococcus sp. MIT 1300 TaxID=3096218 RepID=UPI002A74A608|nr:glucosylglycerol 3-phosphatase [Prochlorococcus sp. MIT 1300]
MNKHIKTHLRSLLSNKGKWLIVQDLDGVCIPLVHDPLNRVLDSSYIYSAAKLGSHFRVLTNGEHEGSRGVNRLVEKALQKNQNTSDQALYLPGLAAGGIQFQTKQGKVSHPGVSKEEVFFLSQVPNILYSLLIEELVNIFPETPNEKLNKLATNSILDTELSPTINLNALFNDIALEVKDKVRLQHSIHSIMQKVISSAEESGLTDSFFLHIAPNLGQKDQKEIPKLATHDDIGTTDIQFMIRGAKKEAGLLVLINEYLYNKYNEYPFGDSFNVRDAPSTLEELLDLCVSKIPKSKMPLLVGVGDTITSNWCTEQKKWLRGGSDRGFLTLIMRLGKKYEQDNLVLVVDSSDGEVNRPSLKNGNLDGISDIEDELKFDYIFTDGPTEYITWFNTLSNQLIIQ